MIVIVNALGGQKKMTQLRRYYTIFNLMQFVLIKKSHISDEVLPEKSILGGQ